jgi:hypothetical protein
MDGKETRERKARRGHQNEEGGRIRGRRTRTAKEKTRR